jgi:hypothetical protein
MVNVIVSAPREVEVWLLVTDPEPFVSVTVPALVVPSPQFHWAVWVSCVPGSVKFAEALTDVLRGAVGGMEIAPTVGATFSTVMVAVPVPVAPWLSVILTVTV